MTIVDIHCHTFNADDLPVRGFVRSTKFDDSRLGDLVGMLADRFAQGRAPGFAKEKRELDHKLGAEQFNEAFEMAAPAEPDPVDELDRDTDLAMAELQKSDPEFVRQLGTALASEEAGELEGIGDWFKASKTGVALGEPLRPLPPRQHRPAHAQLRRPHRLVHAPARRPRHGAPRPGQDPPPRAGGDPREDQPPEHAGPAAA